MRRSLATFLLTLLSLFWFAVALLPQSATQAADNGAEFSVQPILPAAQQDQQLSHFAITPTPGATYPLKVVVTNLSSTATRQFQVQLLAATTASSGQIDYTPSAQTLDQSAPFLLPDLATKQARQQMVTVAPANQQTVTIPIKLPPKQLVGTVLGSVYVQRVRPAANQQDRIGLQNEFAMTVPVILQAGQQPLPTLKIDQVKLATVAGAARLVAAVHNSQPVMFGEITLKAQIRRAGQSQVLISQVDHHYQMAPNSTLPYQIETGGKTLAPGRYQLALQLSSGEKSFKLAKTFTIKANDQQNVEQHLVELNRTPKTSWQLILLTVIGTAVLIGLLIAGWFYWRLQRRVR